MDGDKDHVCVDLQCIIENNEPEEENVDSIQLIPSYGPTGKIVTCGGKFGGGCPLASDRCRHFSYGIKQGLCCLGCGLGEPVSICKHEWDCPLGYQCNFGLYKKAYKPKGVCCQKIKQSLFKAMLYKFQMEEPGDTKLSSPSTTTKYKQPKFSRPANKSKYSKYKKPKSIYSKYKKPKSIYSKYKKPKSYFPLEASKYSKYKQPKLSIPLKTPKYSKKGPQSKMARKYSKYGFKSPIPLETSEYWKYQHQLENIFPPILTKYWEFDADLHPPLSPLPTKYLKNKQKMKSPFPPMPTKYWKFGADLSPLSPSLPTKYLKNKPKMKSPFPSMPSKYVYWENLSSEDFASPLVMSKYWKYDPKN